MVYLRLLVSIKGNQHLSPNQRIPLWATITSNHKFRWPISHWNNRKGGTATGVPFGNRSQTQRRRALIRIRDVSKTGLDTYPNALFLLSNIDKPWARALNAPLRLTRVHERIIAVPPPVRYPLTIIRERPPGLINDVLTVLVFRSWVLVTPHFPSFIQEPQSVPLA